MAIMNHFTRGGQLALHKYHMIKQVGGIALLLCLLSGGLCFGVLMTKRTSPYDRYLYVQYWKAEVLKSISFGEPSKATQDFRYHNGQVREVRSEDILDNRFIQKTVHKVEEVAGRQALLSCLWGLFSLFLVGAVFAYQGNKKTRKKLERGSRILDQKQLTNYIKKQGKSSDLNLDGLPLIKDKETSHILVTGTTGAGKSNCLNILLLQIRDRGDRALVVDLTGDFERRYFRSGDSILNPLDEMSEPWLPWADCLQLPHYDQLAAAMVPKSSAHDPFWENAGKALLAAALEKTAGPQDIEALYHLLARENLRGFSKFFEGTEAASYTHTDGEKMTLSIRATLATQVKSFKLLKNTEAPFSVRKWITEPDSNGWLFLTGNADQREILHPLLSAWLETAANALMTTPPNTGNRLWFVIDELPALQRLPSLETAMAESRKYGGCVLAGVQSFPQLNSIYGSNKAQAILDLFNTKIFFRNTDPNTNQWISRVLGETELTENIENVSYGANTIRDGVSLSQQTRTKPLVLPTEIASLNDLEAYVKLPGDIPIGRVKMGYRGGS